MEYTGNRSIYITLFMNQGNRIPMCIYNYQNFVIPLAFPCFLLIQDIGKTTFNLAIAYTDLN